MKHSVCLAQSDGRVSQGDVFKNVSFLETVDHVANHLSVVQILFPYVFVLTQDCDLQFDHETRSGAREANHDKSLVSVIVAPLYNAEHVRKGEHLGRLATSPYGEPDQQPMRMAQLNSAQWNVVKTNENARYHYMEFPEPTRIPESLIDFKHYFSVPVTALQASPLACTVAGLDRAHVSQRFAAYLSRVGLPEPSASQEA
jgi:hypothetical protein